MGYHRLICLIKSTTLSIITIRIIPLSGVRRELPEVLQMDVENASQTMKNENNHKHTTVHNYTLKLSLAYIYFCISRFDMFLNM